MTVHRSAIIVAALGISILIAVISGCDLGDLLQAKTPQAIQQSAGMPSSMSLNEAESEYRVWFASVSESGARWRANMWRSRWRRS